MASSSSNKRPCPSDSKEEAEPVVVLVEFDGESGGIWKAPAAAMQEDMAVSVAALSKDLARLKPEASVSPPRTRHDLWSHRGSAWGACRREDLKKWTCVDSMDAIKCERVYFWEP